MTEISVKMGEPGIRIACDGGYGHSSTTANTGVSTNEATVANLEMGVSFEMLSDGEIWICDTGASCHSTNDITGASNQREYGSASIGYAGEAVRATKTIDLPCNERCFRSER